MPLHADVRLVELAHACDGWSGAQLSALCREAGMCALREGGRVEAASRVCQRHFVAALERVHQ